MNGDFANGVNFSVLHRITRTTVAKLAVFSVVDFLHRLIAQFAEKNSAGNISNGTSVTWVSSASSRHALPVSV